MNSTAASDLSTMRSDPWSDFGYSNWMENALEVRRAWMRMMGLSEAEIEEHCRNVPPVDLDTELAEYNAMFGIEKINNG